MSDTVKIPATVAGRLMAAGGYSPDVMPYVQDNTTAFSQNLTVRSLALQNFINLLLCVPGERIMDINFGVGLKTYLFRMNDMTTREDLRSNILSQTSTYLPYITINDMQITTPEGEANAIHLEIVFTITTTGESMYLIIKDGAATLLSSQLLTTDEAGRVCSSEKVAASIGVDPDSDKMYVWDPVEAQAIYESCEEMGYSSSEGESGTTGIPISDGYEVVVDLETVREHLEEILGEGVEP
tara:strand:+ start:3313 stop:4032 length:720 start_codon:yes stop_codon:yes gene_type:complete